MSKTNYYCGYKQEFLTKEAMELHHCRVRQKGKNKGNWCKSLVKL